MLDSLTLRARSDSVASREEESRCSSIGILKQDHILKLDLESEMISGDAGVVKTKIHNRDSFANKEFRPKVPPKPSSLLNFGRAAPQPTERNKSYLLATDRTQLEPEPAAGKTAETKAPPPKEKKALKFRKLWRRAEVADKPSLEIRASRIPLVSAPQQPRAVQTSAAESHSSSHKSLISKTFKSLSLKRASAGAGPTSAKVPTEAKVVATPAQDKRLGTSILLLSPNDVEVIEKLEAAPRGFEGVMPRVQTRVELGSSRRARPLTTVVSGREHLVPIINNPREKFLESERLSLDSKAISNNRKLDFRDNIKDSSKKITASNKVTLV